MRKGSGVDLFEITGGNRLRGSVTIGGAKNAALPIMAAAILVEGETVLEQVPDLADVRQMQVLLQRLGVHCERDAQGAMHLRVEDESNTHAEYDLVSKMRASVCVLGPLLAKRKRARVSMPGGCAIGDRPINLHVQGLEAIGAEYELLNGDVVLKAKRLTGAEMFLGGPFGSSVTATANVMMAATLAEGRTIIECAACEPEVVDLADFLNACGARIQGHGTPHLVIDGVPKLTGVQHRVIPDRIEAGTFMIAAAITNGDLELPGARVDHLLAVVDRLRQIGVIVERKDGGVEVSSARRLEPTQITTQPYPGFPTDLQAQVMALLCLADGNSVITEKVFPDRFLHVGELSRMGAQLRKEGPTVTVEGIKRFVGAPVMASDLRASAALILAGLIAKGTTRVHRVYHIDRGYERFEEKLSSVGAHIRRLPE
ncbi:MAG TPA: UDP-N-acetylglucosamine 1-carboxyvinyltransferase [Phycisphaerae bacterium]|nr:UDP-N-acetylglucosamine 1-carboxyvinyltransferase [Phycisphaerae bacterium]HNU46111.1 UDP-N-acetylglucosamine 1-carboxyvinyltransferase [Phycisphaerae bacterium]